MEKSINHYNQAQAALKIKRNNDESNFRTTQPI